MLIISANWLCLLVGLCSLLTVESNLDVAYQWGQLEFDYPSLQARQADISAGLFTPGAFAPVDIDGYYNGSGKNPLVFVTIPRFIRGVSATFGTITNRTLNGNPIIKPFPNWSWHRNSEQCNPNRLLSVFRVALDDCGRLWVLDTGKIGDKQVCAGQILAFDLLSSAQENRVLHRHQFGPEVNLLVTPEVDVRGSCHDSFVYIADSYGFQMFVYDVANDRSWRIRDKTFYPYPTYGTFTIEGTFEVK